jgi:hypothetical protein
MYHDAYLLLNLSGCVAGNLLILKILARPLHGLLCRLCPDETAANFWLAYSRIMLLLAPVLLVLLVNLLAAGVPAEARLQLGLIASVGGLMLGLHTVGKRLSQFITVPATLPAQRPEAGEEAA